jgi:Ca2+-binding RTX toxin-like protein
MPTSPAPSHSRLALFVVVLAFAAAAAPAGADTTTVSLGGGGYTVHVTNEQPSSPADNMIEVTEDASHNLLVTDIGDDVDVVAGPNCSQQTIDRVSCPEDANHTADLEVTPGKGQDQVAINLPERALSGIASIHVFGGPGSDRLVGSAGPDTLDGDGRQGNGAVFTENPNFPEFGQEGNDVLEGAGGRDTLFGQGERDYLNGARRGESGTETVSNTLDGGTGSDFFDAGNSLGADRFTGGSGEDAPTSSETTSSAILIPELINGERAQVFGGDTVSYGPRVFTASGSAGISADLDGVADDGAAGEGDQIDADVESLVGSIRDDTITGSTGANRLEGRLGSDRMEGLAGPDRMRFREGVPDKCFVVGTGDNVDLDLTDPSAICQPKSLPVPFTATVGAKPADETIPYVVIGKRVRKRAAGRVLATVKCPRAAARSCTGTLGLSRALRGKALARRRFRAGPGRTARVRFRLPPSKEAGLKRLGRAVLTTVSQGTSRIGPTSTTVARRF